MTESQRDKGKLLPIGTPHSLMGEVLGRSCLGSSGFDADLPSFTWHLQCLHMSPAQEGWGLGPTCRS